MFEKAVWNWETNWWENIWFSNVEVYLYANEYIYGVNISNEKYFSENAIIWFCRTNIAFLLDFQ